MALRPPIVLFRYLLSGLFEPLFCLFAYQWADVIVYLLMVVVEPCQFFVGEEFRLDGVAVERAERDGFEGEERRIVWFAAAG